MPPDHGMQCKHKAEEGISSEGHTRLRITIGFIGNKAPFMMVSHQTKYTKRNETNDGNGAVAQGEGLCHAEDGSLSSRGRALVVTTTRPCRHDNTSQSSRRTKCICRDNNAVAPVAKEKSLHEKIIPPRAQCIRPSCDLRYVRNRSVRSWLWQIPPAHNRKLNLYVRPAPSV